MRTFFFCLLFVAFVPAAIAQTGNGQPPPMNAKTGPADIPIDAPNAKYLSIDDAIKLAMEKNYTIGTAALDLQIADFEKRRTSDNLLPDLTATAGYGYSYTFNPSSFLGFTSPNASNNLRYNLGSTFNIYSGGADAAHIRSAEYGLESSKQNLNWIRQQTAFNVVGTYINALRYRELVASAQKSLAESQVDLNRQKGLNQAGSTTIGAVYQQEAVVGQNQIALIQAENNYENAKADLLFLLNVAPSEYRNYGLNLTGLDTSTTNVSRTNADTAIVPSALQHIIDTRPDFVSLRAHIMSSEASVDALYGSLLPRLDLSAGIGGSGSSATMFSIQPTNAFNTGLSLTVPIFDKFQNRLVIDEQNVLVEESRIRLTQLEQQLRSDVAKAVNNLQFAAQSLDASDRALRAAEESMRLAEERLKVGAGIQVDVLLAESQLIIARTNRVNVVYNFVFAEKQLQYTLGQWNY